MDAARLAEFAQALDEVLDGLLVGLEPVTAEGDLLQAAGFGVDQAEVAVGGRGKLIRGEDLDRADLEAAGDEGAEARFITGGVEEIAKDDRDARLACLQGATAQRLVQIGGAGGGDGAEVSRRGRRAPGWTRRRQGRGTGTR